MGYPFVQESMSESLEIRPGPDESEKLGPRFPPPKNLGLMLGFLETGEAFSVAELKPTGKASQWHRCASFMARTSRKIQGWKNALRFGE
jgi:hypothetical protein